MTIAELLVKLGVEVDDADKAEKAIKDVRKEVDRLGDTAKKETKKAASAFTRFQRRVEAAGKRVRGGLKTLRAGFAKIAVPVKIAAAAIVAFTASTLAFVTATTASLDSLNKLADRLGTNVETLQRLKFAASQSGVAIEVLTPAVQKLNQQLFDISKGAGQAAIQAFDELRINIDDLRRLNTEQQIGLIGDALKDVEEPARRAALSARIFGEEGGPKMATLLKEGSEGIKRLGDQARGVLTQEEIDRATAYQDRLGELTNTVSGLGRELAVTLAPAIAETIQQITKWIQENDDLIKQGVGLFIDAVRFAFEQLAPRIETVIRLVEVLNQVFDRLGAVIPSVSSSLSGLGGAFVTATSPIFKMIDGLAGVIGALEALNIVSGKAQSSVGSIAAQAASSAAAAVKAATATGGGGGLLASQSPFAGLFPGGGGGGGGRARPGGRPAGGGGGGGGGGAPKVKSGDAAPEGRTFEQLFRALLTGDEATLAERFKDFDAKTPSVADVKPTVAVTFFNMANTFNIASTDPQQVAREVPRMIRQEIGRANSLAAATLGPTVLR